MKRLTANSRAVVLLGVTAFTAVFAQAPPSRPARVGNLELVASLTNDQPAGVAISDAGRLFVTFPRHDGPVRFTVGEIKGGQVVAYPNPDINRADLKRPADTLFSVQTVMLDGANRLWMLDTGTLQFGQPPVKGAPKLVVVDLSSNRVIRTVPVPAEALVPTSALKDFRIDFARGRAGIVFISDSAPGFEGLIVLDFASGHAMRRLTGSPAVSAHPGRTPIVGYEPLLDWSTQAKKNGSPQPWLVGLNAIELSPDKKFLFFSAFTGRRLYSIETGDLSDTTIDNSTIVDEATGISDIGMAGHFALDQQGRLYFMDMEQNGVFRRTLDGRIETVVVDPRLIWPDTMAIGGDEYLYVTTSQQDLRAQFHNGQELRQHPYGLYRVFIGSTPVRATER